MYMTFPFERVNCVGFQNKSAWLFLNGYTLSLSKFDNVPLTCQDNT